MPFASTKRVGAVSCVWSAIEYLLSDAFSQASKTWACFVCCSLIGALQSRAMLGYEKDLPLLARCFSLRDGGTNLVEGECTRSRGHENALTHQRDDVLDQL